MKILGIESSCDETGVAIYDTNEGLLVDQLHSQVDLHAEYGGVVPELASRDHIRKLTPLIKSTLKEAHLTLQDLDGIAYTSGPGLMGALLVGASVGQSLAWGLGIPAIAVHHMEGHLLAPMLETNPPTFPFIGLLVSGGHTMLVEVKGIGQYTVLGESLDDAAGEAFDKTAKLLGLGYPGGPKLSQLAKSGRAGVYHFPRPMMNRPGLDFSFSGLKTFTLTTWQNSDQSEQTKADIAKAFEEAVIDTLIKKCERAIKQTHIKHLVVAGGVGANKPLRERLLSMDYPVSFPRLDFCTDNGAMIAYAGAMRLQAGQSTEGKIDTKPRWSLEDLPAIHH